MNVAGREAEPRKTDRSAPAAADEDPFLAYHLRGSSAAMRGLRAAIAPLNFEKNRDLVRVVLIQGESGSGKNHVAKVIAAHRMWSRESARGGALIDTSIEAYTGRFAEISVPTLPDELVESELFGHRKGAFTGAVSNKSGLLAESLHDILLDEVGDASPAVQAKLLRVIETRKFRPLGGAIDDERETSARFLLATHRDLEARVSAGDFREDLFWRSTEFRLHVPALREQPENIPDLIEYQLANILTHAGLGSAPDAGLKDIPRVDEADIDWACSYDWPGNLRQLRHALVRWKIAEGATSLRSAALSAQAETADLRRPAADTKYAIQAEVRRRLTSCLRSASPAARTLGAFVDGLRTEVEDAVVVWHDAEKPPAHLLESLFPGMKRTSITTKLSQWRTRR